MELLAGQELPQGWDTAIFFDETTGFGKNKQNILMSVFFPRIAASTSTSYPEFTVKAFSCVTLENVTKWMPFYDKAKHSMDNMVPNSARETMKQMATHSRLLFKGDDKKLFEFEPDAWIPARKNVKKDLNYILVKGEWVPHLYWLWARTREGQLTFKRHLSKATSVEEIKALLDANLIEIPKDEIVEPESFNGREEEKAKDKVINIPVAKGSSISPMYTGESLDGLGRESGQVSWTLHLKKKEKNGLLTPFQVAVAKRLNLL